MDDLFDLFNMEPTYTDIYMNYQFVSTEAETLDEDSLIDEVSGIQHKFLGKEQEKVQHLFFKHSAGTELTEEDLTFLRNVYITYYSGYMIIDELEDDDDE